MIYLAIPLLVLAIGVACGLTGSIMIRRIGRGVSPSPQGEPTPRGEIVSGVLVLGGMATIALGGLLLLLFLLVWALLRVV